MRFSWRCTWMARIVLPPAAAIITMTIRMSQAPVPNPISLPLTMSLLASRQSVHAANGGRSRQRSWPRRRHCGNAPASSTQQLAHVSFLIQRLNIARPTRPDQITISIARCMDSDDRGRQGRLGSRPARNHTITAKAIAVGAIVPTNHRASKMASVCLNSTTGTTNWPTAYSTNTTATLLSDSDMQISSTTSGRRSCRRPL